MSIAIDPVRIGYETVDLDQIDRMVIKILHRNVGKYVFRVDERDSMMLLDVGMKMSLFLGQTISSLAKIEIIIRSLHHVRPIFCFYVIYWSVVFLYSQFLSIELKKFTYVKLADENIFDNDKRKSEQLMTFITMINEEW